MRNLREINKTIDSVQAKREADKLYHSTANGRGVTESMKQNWQRKPYYCQYLGGKKK